MGVHGELLSRQGEVDVPRLFAEGALDAAIGATLARNIGTANRLAERAFVCLSVLLGGDL